MFAHRNNAMNEVECEEQESHFQERHQECIINFRLISLSRNIVYFSEVIL